MMRLALILIVGMAGCGAPASTPVDAPVDAPPRDGPRDSDWWSVPDEGGEVRLEYVRFAGGNAATRATAFFYKDPGSIKFFPFGDLNGCTDSSLKTTWPTASNPVGERTYLDPGQVLISGGPQVLSIERRNVMDADVAGRIHPADQWLFHFQGDTGTDGPTYLTEKTSYDVTITGSPDMPAQIFDDVIFVPADFALITPGVAPFPIPAGSAQTFTWTTPPSMEPPAYQILSMVAFSGANGPAVICVAHSGSITVPAAMIDIVRARYPGGGTLVRQHSTHVLRELRDVNGPTGKRIDFLGSWAYETAFTVP